VHHLAPSLPHTIYPMLAERLASECATRQLPYHCHPSITAALRAHLRWLKAMGAAPVQPVGGGRPAVP
jgi:fatty acid desaturase